jgi:hypothetical protein
VCWPTENYSHWPRERKGEATTTTTAIHTRADRQTKGAKRSLWLPESFFFLFMFFFFFFLLPCPFVSSRRKGCTGVVVGVEWTAFNVPTTTGGKKTRIIIIIIINLFFFLLM